MVAEVPKNYAWFQPDLPDYYANYDPSIPEASHTSSFSSTSLFMTAYMRHVVQMQA